MRKIARPASDGLLSVAERRDAGQAIRHRVSRGAHALWQPPASRPDPVDLIVSHDAGLIATLLPLRYARMRADPFAFLRGAGCVMATDLATAPDTGLIVQACGDAHPLNFGAYAGSDGEAVFDITDFDETLRAPFEWDLKRLAVGLAVIGRMRDLSDKAIRALARRAAHAYRRHIHDLAAVPPLDAWGSRIDLEDAIDDISDRDVRRQTRQLLHHAISTTRGAYRGLLTDNGGMRLKDRQPSMMRLSQHEGVAAQAFQTYMETLPNERRILVDRYRLRDIAFKAVGVGSLGTFCAIGLFVTADGDPLLLQLKQAVESVLAPHVRAPPWDHQGRRVVAGQQATQAAEDIFLGWSDADGRQFYVRHLKDPRVATITEDLQAGVLPFYARLCGRTLARAHARTGDAASIAGYLGEGDSFDSALAEFAIAYADQTARDFRQFNEAIAAGRLPAEEPAAT